MTHRIPTIPQLPPISARLLVLAAAWLTVTLAGCGRGAPIASEGGTDNVQADGDPGVQEEAGALPAGVSLRLGTTRYRTPAWQGGAAITADGKLVAYRNTAETIRIVEAQSGKEVRVVPIAEQRIGFHFRFTEDARRFVFTSFATATVLDAETGKKLSAFTGKGDSSSQTALSADGTLAATTLSFENSPVTLWNVPAGKAIGAITAAQNDVLWLALAGNGKVLATAGRHRRAKETDPALDHIVQIWDAATLQEKKRIDAGSPVTAVKLSRDGALLLTELPIVRQFVVWDTATGQKAATIVRPDTAGAVAQVYFSADGKSLAFAQQDGRVAAWSAVTGKQQGVSSVPCQQLLGVGFREDGAAVAVGREAQTVRVWRIPGEPPPPVGHFGVVTALQFSPDGKELLTVGSDYRVVRWDALTGKQKELVFDPPVSLTRRCDRMEAELSFFTSDGKWCIACLDRSLMAIDLTAKNKYVRLAGKASLPRWESFALSPDGTKLFAIGTGFTGANLGVSACVWEIKEGQLLDEKTFPLKNQADARSAAEKYLREKYAREAPAIMSGNSPAALGRLIIDPVTSVGSIGGRLTLKDPQSGRVLFDEDTGCAGKNAWAVSPDGKRLALGWNDSTVMIFDLPRKR